MHRPRLHTFRWPGLPIPTRAALLSPLQDLRRLDHLVLAFLKLLTRLSTELPIQDASQGYQRKGSSLHSVPPLLGTATICFLLLSRHHRTSPLFDTSLPEQSRNMRHPDQGQDQRRRSKPGRLRLGHGHDPLRLCKLCRTCCLQPRPQLRTQRCPTSNQLEHPHTPLPLPIHFRLVRRGGWASDEGQ
jgi:hypothetical protein